jgi:poly-gamma-glutamate synthase PgsB/CapB
VALDEGRALRPWFGRVEASCPLEGAVAYGTESRYSLGRWVSVAGQRERVRPDLTQRSGAKNGEKAVQVKDLLAVGTCLGLILSLLGAEQTIIRRLRRAVPTRVVVLGTRGKSSVVRLIAAGLRGAGLRAVYKTTGSQAVLGRPDGSEHPIHRRFVPSPLEQRRVLWESRRLAADVAVIEAMSIRAEALRAEVRGIIAPRIVVITNLRRDHLADLPDPVAAFAEAVPLDATALCSEDVPQELLERLRDRGIRTVCLPATAGSDERVSVPYEEWGSNLALALEVCAYLGIPKQCAAEGVRSIKPDVGALSAWRMIGPQGVWYAVSGFAANDPESTKLVLRRALERWGRPDGSCVGLLNLREDRGDRTEQWVDELSRGIWPFDRLAVVGSTPWSVRRRLRKALAGRLLIPRKATPERILDELALSHPPGGVLFGFGNLGGVGMRLVEYWSRKGEPA